MAPKKQPTTSEGIIAKEKFIATAGDNVSPSGLNLSPIMKETVFAPLQGAAEDIHPSSTYEAQLQMFDALKEEMAKQRALFNHEREQSEQDRENAARERS